MFICIYALLLEGEKIVPDKRNLENILKDIEITAMRIGEYKYVNSAMISEALEYITGFERYYEVQGDLIDEIEKVIGVLDNE